MISKIFDDGVVSERGYEHHERNVAECMICYLSLRTGHGQGLETPSELQRFCCNAGQAGLSKYFNGLGETCYRMEEIKLVEQGGPKVRPRDHWSELAGGFLRDRNGILVGF